MVYEVQVMSTRLFLYSIEQLDPTRPVPGCLNLFLISDLDVESSLANYYPSLVNSLVAASPAPSREWSLWKVPHLLDFYKGNVLTAHALRI
ncbi:hypothetical protein TNCV_1827501 [Trichonephila clavipes]|nr:hypothetical protein TNCV_1827501 [Trichonephila clavipes]